MSDAERAYASLLVNPADFLSRHLVIPAGSNTSESKAAKNFEINEKAPGSQVYQVKPRAEGSKPWPGGHTFSAAYLKMEPATAAECGTTVGKPADTDFEINDAKLFELRPPADRTAHVLMITGQLTGCTVCWRHLGNGGLLIAHLQPQRPLTGLQLYEDVSKHGLMRGQRVQGAWGRKQYEDFSCHFFGCWTPAGGGRWRLFAQMRDVLTPGASDDVAFVVEINA